jgi:DNA repair photolyase
MIVSASRRTDIPAFYSEWLENRLIEEYVLVRNPFNPHHVSRVSLRPADMECIVFWTKNPKPMLPRLKTIDLLSVPYYFLFTVTAYGEPLERNIPSLEETIDTFRRLSRITGPQKTIWRYDPVIFTNEKDAPYHRERFEYLCSRLENFTKRCIVSFLDMYKKCRKNLEELDIRTPSVENMVYIAGDFRMIADKYGISVQSCAEEADLSSSGVENGKCIDNELISEITGLRVSIGKDPNQRKRCRCAKSVDIGSYDTCTGGCLYCYANSDPETAQRNYASHDPKSPLLYGNTQPSDRIVEREMNTLF